MDQYTADLFTGVLVCELRRGGLWIKVMMAHGFIVTLLMVTPAFNTLISGAEMMALEYALIRNITSNYSPEARPVRNPRNPVLVNLTLWISGLQELNMKQKLLATHGIVLLMWRDEFLTWRPEDFWNQTSVVLNPDKVWTPPVGPDDSGEDTRTRIERKDKIHIQYDGKVRRDFGWAFRSICDMDGTYMPFDQHVCYLTFSAYYYRSDLLQLLPGKEKKTQRFTSGEFALIDNHMRVRNVTYGGYYYSRIEVRILLKRLPMSTMVTTLLPSAFLSFLAGLTYDVPVDSGERLSYGVSILLSFGVFLLLLANQQPPTTDSVPWIMILILSVMALIVVTLWISILQSVWYHRKETNMSAFFKVIACWNSPGTVVLKRNENHNLYSGTERSSSSRDQEETNCDPCSQAEAPPVTLVSLQLYAKRVDRSCQIFYYVIWVSMYASFFIFVPILGNVENDPYDYLYE